MFPAFAHFRRTATKDTVLNEQEIKEGEKVVMWYTSSNRDETHYEDPDRFDVLRNPDHQAFGAGGRHFCLGAALARLELKILLEETLARYPEHGAGRQARLRRVGLPQPDEIPAGAARPLTGSSPQRPSTRTGRSPVFAVLLLHAGRLAVLPALLEALPAFEGLFDDGDRRGGNNRSQSRAAA